MNIKGVVFDFGGVMTTTIMPERVRKITDRRGIDWSILERGFANYRRLMDGGYIDLREMYDLVWADANIVVDEETKQQILSEDMASFLYRNERTLELMRRLKARGFKLGILTNMPPSFAKPFHETFADFIAEADALVISGLEHMFKPQRQIYDLLVSRIGLRPDELCFFDDSPTNCEGARQAGWNVIRFHDVDQVEREFNELVSAKEE